MLRSTARILYSVIDIALTLGRVILGAPRRERRSWIRRPSIRASVAAIASTVMAVRLVAPWLVAAPRAGQLRIGSVSFAPWYVAKARQRWSPLFTDASGRAIGLFPAALAGRGPTDYLAIPVDTAPDTWWQVVVALEDRAVDAWWHLGGIDWRQVALSPVRWASTGRWTGASTLVMQLVKTLQADADYDGSARVLRKLRDFAHAPLLAAYLDSQPPGALKAWYATHVPLLKSNLHGLEAAALTLWGKRPPELSAGQQAILAAAAKYRIDPAHPRGWARTVRRARYGLDVAHALGRITTETWRAGRAEVEKMRHPRRRRARGCVGRRLARHPRRWRLDRRALLLARDPLIQALQELRAAYGPRWWRTGAREVRLTIDLEQHCRLHVVAKRAHRRLVARLRRRQAAAGVPARARLRRGRSALTMAIADADGRLVFVHHDREYPSYHGAPGPSPGARKIGSIGKIIVALAAAAEGDHPTGTRYFEQARTRVHRGQTTAFRNHDDGLGSRDASNPRHWVSARAAFARSNNLAMMWRLERSGLTGPQLDALTRLFGFTPTSSARRALVVDIPMGNILATPRSVHRAFHALALAASGRSVRRCTPHVVDRIWLRGWRTVAMDEPEPSMCQGIAAHVRTGRRRRFILSALGGVVDPTARGTASRALGALTPRMSDRFRWHIAKTGTTSRRARDAGGPAPGTNAALIVGALEADGRPLSYFAQLRPTQPSADLGPRVYGGDVGAVVKDVLVRLMSRRR